nr:hypothetical protein CFP56_36306 [Quercus suber]
MHGKLLPESLSTNLRYLYNIHAAKGPSIDSLFPQREEQILSLHKSVRTHHPRTRNRPPQNTKGKSSNEKTAPKESVRALAGIAGFAFSSVCFARRPIEHSDPVDFRIPGLFLRRPRPHSLWLSKLDLPTRSPRTDLSHPRFTAGRKTSGAEKGRQNGAKGLGWADLGFGRIEFDELAGGLDSFRRLFSCSFGLWEKGKNRGLWCGRGP